MDEEFLPSSNRPTRFAQTLQGLVAAADLGVVLPHEHVFCSWEVWAIEPKTPEEVSFWDAPIELTNLGRLRRRSFSNRTNINLDELDVAIDEIRSFAASGGGTIVDVTPVEHGRNPVALRTVSDATGIHMICGTGHYVAEAHPPEIEGASVDDLARWMVEELTLGIGESEQKAGVIGEIGTSVPLHPDEAKMLRAAAYARLETGAPISVHLSDTGALGHEALDILEKSGVDLAGVILGHVDGQEPDLGYLTSLARRGPFLEFDYFGAMWQSDDLRDRDAVYWPPPPGDDQRMRTITTLIEHGFADRILLSHDTALKIQLSKYGGYGYSHLLDNIRPLFGWFGLDKDVLGLLYRSNPQRAVSWEPK